MTTRETVLALAKKLFSNRQTDFNQNGFKGDAENKRMYVDFGNSKEQWFCDQIASVLGLKTRINEEKTVEGRYWEPDLQVEDELGDWQLGELKTQWSPFFKSQEFLGIPAKYSFTFDVTDLDNWTAKNKPDGMRIFFLVVYPESEMFNIRCPGIVAVYEATFGEVKALAEKAQVRPQNNRPDTGDGRDAKRNKVNKIRLDVRNLHLHFRYEIKGLGDDEPEETLDFPEKSKGAATS